MQFDSVADFIAMGGYGVYIWAVYGLSVVVLIVNIVMPRRSMKRTMRLALKNIQLEQQAILAKADLADASPGEKNLTGSDLDSGGKK